MRDSRALLPDITWTPSPNFNTRQHALDMLVLHYTGMADDQAAIDWLCNPASQVSCHYFVFPDGTIHQLVAEACRAWHAGVACWQGAEDLNSASIGIEIANPGHEHGYVAFPERQIASLITLCQGITNRHKIVPHRVLAHSDIAPERKEDPGELFPWHRLAEKGIGHYVLPEPVSDGRFFQEGDTGQPVLALQSMLALYGYNCPESGDFDAQTRMAVTAFQRHFRQDRVDGVADYSTINTLHRLLKSLPVSV